MKAPVLRGLSHSPGWTRTNNPPVNSRMLCQLSYRGTVARRANCSGVRAELREIGSGRADAVELLLELLGALGVGGRELPAQLALAQAEEELLGGLFVDPLGRCTCVELGQERDELRVGLPRLK